MLGLSPHTTDQSKHMLVQRLCHTREREQLCVPALREVLSVKMRIPFHPICVGGGSGQDSGDLQQQTEKTVSLSSWQFHVKTREYWYFACNFDSIVLGLEVMHLEVR